jgi:predicted dehydrogenase
LHFADAKTAPGANKHVLVKRPFTLNAAGAEEIVAIAEADASSCWKRCGCAFCLT